MTKFPSDGVGYNVYEELKAKRHVAELIALQDAEQAEWEALQPKLTPDQYQELELARFNSNEEAEHARFNAGNNSNLQGC